jgi:hypothetical protein
MQNFTRSSSAQTIPTHQQFLLLFHNIDSQEWIHTTDIIYHYGCVPPLYNAEVYKKQQFMQKSTRSSSAQQILTHQQFWLVVFRIVFFV